MLARGLHEVLFEGGDQTLVHLPTVKADASPAPTVQIEDLLESETSASRFIVASGAATLDSVSTTTDANAGVGESDPRLVSVASSAGASAGTYYEISSTNGTEVFRAEIVDVGQMVASNPLSAYHPSGATVAGMQLAVTFPTASASNATLFDEDRPLRVLWVYSLGGRVVRVAEQVRIVKSYAEDALIGTVEQTIRATHPALVQALHEYGNSLRDVVEEAAKEVTSRLRARDVDVSQFMGGRVAYQLVRAKTLEFIAENGIHPGGLDPDRYLEHMAAHFARKWSDMSGRSPRDTVDVTRSDDVATATQSSKIRRSVRRA